MRGQKLYAVGSFADWLKSRSPEGWWLESVVEFQHVWITDGSQSQILRLGLYDELVRVPMVVEEEGIPPRKEMGWVYVYEQEIYWSIEEAKMRDLGIEPNPNPFR